MSYTELLLVFIGSSVVMVDDEPPRGGAGASGRGSHERDQELGIADRARSEVLCGSAAERLVGWI
jgi:hypothetical protein